MTATIISLRKLSRVAPELAEPVLVTHGDRIIGEFRPEAPRPAQDGESPARTGAPRTRAASDRRSESAPGGAPTFRPAPKPGGRRKDLPR